MPCGCAVVSLVNKLADFFLATESVIGSTAGAATGTQQIDAWGGGTAGSGDALRTQGAGYNHESIEYDSETRAATAPWVAFVEEPTGPNWFQPPKVEPDPLISKLGLANRLLVASGTTISQSLMRHLASLASSYSPAARWVMWPAC